MRREVEQLRSEVRQKDERFLQSNEKVVLDWLKETVGDLNMEVKSLELRESGHRVFDKDSSFVRVKSDIIDMKRDILNLRVEEERSLSKIEELEKNIEHVSNGEEIALREVMEIKNNEQIRYSGLHGKPYKKSHKNLSKKHLRKWMEVVDGFQEELFSLVSRNKEKLSRLEKEENKKETICENLSKKIQVLEIFIQTQKNIPENGISEDSAKAIIKFNNRLEKAEEKLKKLFQIQNSMEHKVESLAEDLKALMNRNGKN